MSYIYFIQAQDNGPIKIGFTGDNPRKRMVKIQSDCPWPVQLLGAIEGTVSQEKQIHLVLARYKTQGEWFEPHPHVVAAVNLALECGVLAPDDDAIDFDGMNKLRAYRLSKKLSQSDLAASVGVKKSAISRIEKGKRVPSMGLVARIVEISDGELSANDFIPELSNEIAS